MMRCAFIFLCGVLAAQAQEVSNPDLAPTIRVHGEATVSAEPDQAQFDIGVVTQASTATDATDQNRAQTNAVIQELRALVPKGDIKTVNFSVNPSFKYPAQGGPATITGYTANNTVRLILTDISLLQKIIDVAMRSGANSINRLTFSLRNEQAVRAKALAAAATEAKAGAEALASSLQLQMGPLLRVEEGQPVVVSPAREISFGRATSNSMVPLSPGRIDVHADVNLTYRIAAEGAPSKQTATR